MSFVMGAIVPHPPIIIPEVGGSETKKVAKTIRGLEQLADDIMKIKVDTLLFTSPHSPYDYETFLIDNNATLEGTLSSFGHPEIGFKVDEDEVLSEKIINGSRDLGVSLSKRGAYNDKGKGFLDHGITVPYYFISKQRDYKITSISISGLPLNDHYELGKVIGRASEKSDKRIAFIASGDLSHGLKSDAPAGFAERGEEFDRVVVEKIRDGKIKELKDMEGDLINKAAECGLRSFVILAGALDGRGYDSRIRSYEGPFGVGYLVAGMRIR